MKRYLFLLVLINYCGWFGFHTEIYPVISSRINNYDTTVVKLSPWFFGCIIDSKNSCSGRIAVGLESNDLIFEYVSFDTVVLDYGNEAMHFLLDSARKEALEIRDGKRYKHINFGKVSIPSSMAGKHATVKYIGYLGSGDSLQENVDLEVKFLLEKRSGNVVTDN